MTTSDHPTARCALPLSARHTCSMRPTDHAATFALVGAGGHGRETLQALRRAGVAISAVYDDSEENAALLASLGVPFAGPVTDCVEPAYIGIGSGTVRRELAAKLRSAPPAVDPSAVVGDDVRIGDSSVIFAQATVTTNVTVGRNSHIGRGAAVGHDSVLGDFVSVMPLAGISGKIVVEDEAFIGAGALIRQGVRIGAGATVGMGAVVLSDVPAGVTVVGNPARSIRFR